MNVRQLPFEEAEALVGAGKMRSPLETPRYYIKLSDGKTNDYIGHLYTSKHGNDVAIISNVVGKDYWRRVTDNTRFIIDHQRTNVPFACVIINANSQKEILMRYPANHVVTFGDKLVFKGDICVFEDGLWQVIRANRNEAIAEQIYPNSQRTIKLVEPVIIGHYDTFFIPGIDVGTRGVFFVYTKHGSIPVYGEVLVKYGAGLKVRVEDKFVEYMRRGISPNLPSEFWTTIHDYRGERKNFYGWVGSQVTYKGNSYQVDYCYEMCGIRFPMVLKGHGKAKDVNFTLEQAGEFVRCST